MLLDLDGAMAQLILRLLNLFAVLAATVWLVRVPSYAALATFLGLLAVLLGQEFAAQPKSRQAHDRSLFEAFLGALPSDGRFVSFLKAQDIGAPFRRNVLDEMYTFLREWGDAEHEFKKGRLERQRAKLYQQTDQFSRELSLAIFPDGSEFFSMGINDWEDRPDIMEKREHLNRMATDIYKSHQELVRIGKKCVL
jgi:hypothetical protein